jgi:Protein of unknown function (DUF2946)
MPRRHPKLTAWLGLFAICLAVLMPIASQSWINAHRLDRDVDAAFCSAVAADARSSGPSTLHALHLDACGYCSLLAHSPAIGAALHASSVAATPPIVPGESRSAAPRRSASQYLRAYPRAPPIDA